jgi:predicted lipoprotein
MKRRHVFYAVVLGALLLLVGSSVEFRSLEAKRAEERAGRFDPAQYARDFWDQRLEGVLDAALGAGPLISLFNRDMSAAVRKGQTLGQSRVHAYLLKGKGKIVSLRKDGLCVSVVDLESDPEILICTGSYISGNAVRDASGLIDVSTFSDTMKFNRISSEINSIAVEEVIKPFLAKEPRMGMMVRFVGAVEVAEDATETLPFGGRKGPSESGADYHLLKMVPVRLDLESFP